MRKKRPLILVTNDDGYQAKGIKTLIKTMKQIGDVVVFAPYQPQSGMSSAITTVQPLRCIKYNEEEGLTAYFCTGTPVDCVKLALNEFLDRKPDLLVSGINHGSNAGISVIYSGTMGAAIEGCIFDVPSIGVSLLDHSYDADFSQACNVAKKAALEVLKNGLPRGVCLNINVPRGEVRGIKIATQTKGKWVNEYKRSTDGIGKDVYWITGRFENREERNEASDEWFLKNGYAAVVPVKIDMTAHDYVETMKQWNMELSEDIAEMYSLETKIKPE